MDEKSFVWTSKLAKKMFQFRFQHDCLFKKNKQPWGEFHKVLLRNGFPEEMTVKHVSKKWSYTFDTYKIAKKTNNKDWKYYKLFDKYFGKRKTLDKYESWSDEWRLKLIICIIEAKELKLDFQMLWRTVERAMRCQDLPSDCSIQDIKRLWHHIRMTFNRKYRLKIKKGAELTEWPLYDVMLDYYKRFEPEYLVNLESACIFGNKQVPFSRHCKNRKKDINKNESVNDFHWTKDITEAFIQSRLQNDWLFRESKWPWNEFLSIMREEYGFPKTLTSRDICRKWAATFSEYQKAKATNNKLWVYYNLFELYLGEGSLSLNPLVDWQEEWVFKFISARTSLDHMFKFTLKDHTEGWREVEKRIRNMGLPLDHSLLDLPEMWTHLVKTFKWKRKFANKGILHEQWPYYDAMAQYVANQSKQPIAKQKREAEYFDDADNDDFDDDMKLFDLKQRLETPLKPKFEMDVTTLCRSCSNEDGCVNIFDEISEDGLDVADKLKIIGGIEVERTDRLPSVICLNCLNELENAFKFRRKCQDVDRNYRNTAPKIKIEFLDKKEEKDQRHDNNDTANDDTNKYEPDETDIQFEADGIESDTKNETQSTIKKEIGMHKRKKRERKVKYHYWKICEICGKHTRNLISHLDTHSTGKTYSCDVCEKKFKFKSGLIIHKAVHDPTPRKTCEVCGKTFHVLAQYRRHFVYHANERKFECETCGKRFNTVDILRVHNRTHTDERPFSCEECGKTFRTAGCVSRHKRIVHRNIKKVK